MEDRKNMNYEAHEVMSGGTTNPAQYSEIRDLPSSSLDIDPPYHRAVSMSHVRKIVEHFDPRLVNFPKVSERDGHYYVMDGVHTVMALRAMHTDGEDFPITCRVYHGLTCEEEALLFVKMNEASERPDRR